MASSADTEKVVSEEHVPSKKTDDGDDSAWLSHRLHFEKLTSVEFLFIVVSSFLSSDLAQCCCVLR